MPKPKRPPAWLRCTMCDDFWCVIHWKHVADCPCPPVEMWMSDPYSGESPGPAAEHHDA